MNPSVANNGPRVYARARPHDESREGAGGGGEGVAPTPPCGFLWGLPFREYYRRPTVASASDNAPRGRRDACQDEPTRLNYFSQRGTERERETRVRRVWIPFGNRSVNVKPDARLLPQVAPRDVLFVHEINGHCCLLHLLPPLFLSLSLSLSSFLCFRR